MPPRASTGVGMPCQVPWMPLPLMAEPLAPGFLETSAPVRSLAATPPPNAEMNDISSCRRSRPEQPEPRPHRRRGRGDPSRGPAPARPARSPALIVAPDDSRGGGGPHLHGHGDVDVAVDAA